MMQSTNTGLFPKKKTAFFRENDFRLPQDQECFRLEYSSLFPREKTPLKIADISISTELGSFSFDSLENLMYKMDSLEIGGSTYLAKRNSIQKSIRKLALIYHEYRLSDEERSVILATLTNLGKSLNGMESSFKPGQPNLDHDSATLILSENGFVNITRFLELLAEQALQARDYKEANLLFHDARKFATNAKRCCANFEVQNQFSNARFEYLDNNIKNTQAAVQNNVRDEVLQANQAKKMHLDFLAQMDKLSGCKFPVFQTEEAHVHSLMFHNQPFVDTGFTYQNVFGLDLPPNTKWKRLIPNYLDFFDLSILRPSRLIRHHASNSPLAAALLAILAYDKQLLCNEVYPQYFDGTSKNIIHNPDGIYLLKLYVDGAYRKIFLDNFFPVMPNNQSYGHFEDKDLLLSLWEKAFWKLHDNGLNINNYNPSHYVWTILGPYFIPEIYKISKISAQVIWNHLKSCVTGKRGIATAKNKGTGRDDSDIYYTVLRVIEHPQRPDFRVLMMQNPCKLTGVEQFASLSVDRYPQFEKEIKDIYEEFNGLINDNNGIFFIGFETFVECFDGLYVNWNTKLYYRHKYTLHRIDDLANFSALPAPYMFENPQFQVTFKEPMNKLSQLAVAVEWHSSKIPAASQLSFDVYSQAKEYVFYESKVESQGYIVKNSSKNTGNKILSSQLRSNDFPSREESGCIITVDLRNPLSDNKKDKCAYTLHLYSTEILDIQQIEPNLKFSRIEGAIKQLGSASHFDKQFINNHQICVTPSAEISNSTFFLYAEIKNKTGAALGLKLVNVSQYIADQRIYVLDEGSNLLSTSTLENPYHSALEFTMPVGTMTKKYNLIVVPLDNSLNRDSPYEIQMFSNLKFDAKKLLTEEEEFTLLQIKGKWTPSNAGGCYSPQDYRRNPKYIIQTDSGTKLKLRIDSANPNFYVNAAMYKSPFRLEPTAPNFELFSTANPILSTHYAFANNTMTLMHSQDSFHQISETRVFEAGTYIIIPSTSEPNCQGDFTLSVYHNKGLRILCKGYDMQ